MTANERQVGGDHYKTGDIEVWDIMFGPEFLVGCAVKHVSRWRKKNGMQDLEKALHYAQKLKEIAPQYVNRQYLVSVAVANDRVRGWMHSAGLGWVERVVCDHLLYCKGLADVESAIGGIEYLIACERGKTEVDVGELYGKSNGACGMRPGDRVQYELDGRTGTAREFLQDGDAVVRFDDGSLKTVKWNFLRKLEKPTSSKPYDAMTDDELATELQALEAAQSRATGWGAAVGVRGEYIDEIKREQRRRRELRAEDTFGGLRPLCSMDNDMCERCGKRMPNGTARVSDGKGKVYHIECIPGDK